MVWSGNIAASTLRNKSKKAGPIIRIKKFLKRNCYSETDFEINKYQRISCLFLMENIISRFGQMMKTQTHYLHVESLFAGLFAGGWGGVGLYFFI